MSVQPRPNVVFIVGDNVGWGNILAAEGQRFDGVDASGFLPGESRATGRDQVIYYGSDAGVMSVKWRTMKVVSRFSESNSGPIFQPQWPMVFDLINAPIEQWDLAGRSGRARPSTRTSNRERRSPDTTGNRWHPVRSSGCSRADADRPNLPRARSRSVTVTRQVLRRAR